MSLPRLLVDCRWLSMGGAGRATELLLKGLGKSHMEADWILWGPRAVEERAWPGCRVIVTGNPPNAMSRQRDWFRIPPCDLALFMHQERPLRSVPAVTVMYDTIRVRLAGGTLERQLMRSYFRRVAALSRELITGSHYARRCIREDLGIHRTPVSVVRWPVDEEFVHRIHRLRQQSDRWQIAFYAGRFMPHKNLKRLIAAFERTDFRGTGGRLVLVGGSAPEVREMQARLGARERDFIEVRGRCSQPELDELFARSLFLVQPSLEEGFGLPVWEALSCGLPVCASDGGSLPEITGGLVRHFPATSIEAMVDAIDRCATESRSLSAKDQGRRSHEFGRAALTVEDFAGQFQAVLRRHL